MDPSEIIDPEEAYAEAAGVDPSFVGEAELRDYEEDFKD